MKKFIYPFIFFSTIFTVHVFAHSGGHFHKEDGNTFNIWKLNSGKTLVGNFSFAKDNSIFLEQEDGRIVSVALNELCEQDQRLAKWKMKKINSFNVSNQVEAIPVTRNHYEFLPFIIFCFLLLVLFLIYQSYLKNIFFYSKIELSSFCLLFLILLFIACSKSSTSTMTTNDNPINNPVVVTIPKTSSGYIDSAFSAFKPAIATTWDNTYFYIASNGIPSHNMMIGITNWQQQVPIAQPYNGTNSWSIPLQPDYATIPLSTKTNLLKGAVAVAVNGIPIFNALNNRGEDAYKIGELDNWGGHCGRADDYHYHAAPLHLSATNGLKPIAFALDGFAVFGSKEPDGTTMNVLDTCHGHVYSGGVYHYHGTTDYPYVVGAMRGKVTVDPATNAPENQVIPQAFTKSVRPATSPLSGAAITDFVAQGTNGYLLTYKRGTKNGYIKYSWDASNKYTFILTDTAGVVVTNVYQR